MGKEVPPSQIANPRPSRFQISSYDQSHHCGCEELLASLPEWFGIPEANAGYLGDLSEFPSWVALTTLTSGEVGGVVGAITITEPMPQAFEVHFLAVARSCHRSGVGSSLMAYAEGWAKSRGGRFMQVKTIGPSSADPHYALTRSFYQAIGYSPLFESDRLWDPHNPALTLVKHLECSHTP